MPGVTAVDRRITQFPILVAERVPRFDDESLAHLDLCAGLVRSRVRKDALASGDAAHGSIQATAERKVKTPALARAGLPRVARVSALSAS